MNTENQKMKQTEIGWIPGDWEVKKLGDCLLKNPDYGINAPAVEFDDALPKYLRITDISENGKFIKATQASVNSALSNAFYLEKGDIVFARTGASVGKTYLYDENDGRLVFAGFLIRIKADPEILNYNYLIYLTQTKSYWAWVSTNSMRSGQPGLNSNEYKALPIPLPPTKAEQTAIATALSDADAWIGSLEKLIEKKRLLKQGAMQELLKPKEGWVVKRLGEVLKVCHGKSQKEISVSTGKYPILASGGVIGTTNHFLHSGPSVLIGRKGTIDRPQFMDTPFWTVDTLFYTDIHEDFSPKYVFYKFCSIDWMSFNEASGVPSLNAKTIENIEVAFPPSLEEQELISISLSEFDSQILLLENQLSKARQIKQGMMQQLLTGKIRLI